MKSTATDITKFIQNMPKTELHLHLEGCVTPTFWFDLIQKHEPGNPVLLKALENRFVYQSFFDFLDTYKDVIFSFTEPDDLYDLTKFMMMNLVDQKVRYCEVMFTPYFFVKRGLPYEEIMIAIDAGAKEIESQYPIKMKLIYDGPRNFGNDVVAAVFDMAINDKTGRVIGVGLGGDEKNYPATLFQKEFDKARSHGLKLIAHAGETAGETSILETIEKLKVSRIGHGLGITKGGKVETLIKENNITVDLCPGSNLATGVIQMIEAHPFRDYLDSGYAVSLNSDDPGLFNTSLNQEYLNMANLHKLSEKNLAQIALNGINGTFLSDAEKTVLSTELETYLKNV